MIATTTVDRTRFAASAPAALWSAAGFVVAAAALRAATPDQLPVLLLSFGLLGGLSLAGAV